MSKFVTSYNCLSCCVATAVKQHQTVCKTLKIQQQIEFLFTSATSRQRYNFHQPTTLRSLNCCFNIYISLFMLPHFHFFRSFDHLESLKSFSKITDSFSKFTEIYICRLDRLVKIYLCAVLFSGLCGCFQQQSSRKMSFNFSLTLFSFECKEKFCETLKNYTPAQEA